MVLGVTGGMATGKSLVTAMLKELGAEVVDADAIAREIVEPGREALSEIVRRFGDGVIAADGALDRKALAEIVFADARKLAALCEITHPRIRAEIRRRIRELKKKDPQALIVVDAPLLFETGLDREMDKVLVVCAPEHLQLERARSRDGLTEEQARSRMKAQMPLEEKLRRADYVVDNSSTVERTRERVEELYRELAAAPRPPDALRP
ncbi:MAG TPA: dephospho-CoA kinase [Deltaproteobacteria bacterium]|nr:dephospho-CoA kinase [Deltaproteobacteria bacterium]